MSSEDGDMRDWTRRRALRAFGTAGASALAVPAIASCGSAPVPPITSGEVTLELWTHDPGYVTTFSTAIKRQNIVGGSAFDYRLDITKAAGGDLVSRMISQAVASGDTPGLIGLLIDHFPRLMRARIAPNLLVDLTDTLEEHGDDLLRTEPYRANGRLYALESDTSVSVLYYRQDEFDRHNLPVDVDTWEDLAEIGAELHAKTGKSLGMVATHNNTNIFQVFLQYLMQRGGSAFDAHGDLAIDSTEAEETLEFLAAGVRSGFLIPLPDPYSGACAAALKSGKLIAIAMPSWYNIYGLQANVAEQEGLWRMRTLPPFAGGGHIASTLGGTGFGIVNDKATSKAAEELLRRVYLSREGQILRYESGGYLPTLRPLYRDPAFSEIEDRFLGGQRVFDVYGRAIEDLPEYYQAAEMGILTDVAGGPILSALKGDTEPAAALSSIVDAYRGQVKR